MQSICKSLIKNKQFSDVKRLLESLQGDPETRKIANSDNKTKQNKLIELKTQLYTSDIEIIWQNYNDLKNLFDSAESDRFPLLKTYKDEYFYTKKLLANLSVLKLDTNFESFNYWRKRMFYRASSETGVSGKTVCHPLFAFELSKGCSVGCWFCAFSPEKFRGYYPYNSENSKFWQNILETNKSFFGKAAGASPLYHSTEPFDNPDYLEFLEDFHQINGILPQTTTAVPFRDLNLTKKLLERRKKSPDMPDRFSVLSLKTLRKIHSLFTPEELEYVNLVLQNNESLCFKAEAGRARNKSKAYENEELKSIKNSSGEDLLNPPSVECIYGFIVNMVDQSIKLISPCRTSDIWPLGYRIHFESNFRDLSEYKELLQKSIEEYMPRTPAADIPLSFRQDLNYEKIQDGFKLSSPFYEHNIKKEKFLPILGDIINSGKKTAGEIADKLSNFGVSYFETINHINKLYEHGLLADEVDQKLFNEAPIDS